MARIRAAVAHGFNQPLTLEEIELRAPLSGEIEVTIEAVAICHSDIHYLDGAWGGQLPLVLGHEAAGRVTALGGATRGIELGDRVVVTLIRGCGHCVSCASGAPTRCETSERPHPPLTATDGGAVTQAMDTGAFAEKVVVDQSQVVVLPDSISADVASLLACGVITGVGAVVNAADLRPGQDAVVIGAGGVGLNAIQGARIAGARRIVAVDLAPEKLEAAREFGATDTILASDPTPWRTAREILGKGADAVFVTVGVVGVYQSAPKYLAPGGALVAVGMPGDGETAAWEPVLLASDSQKFIGSKMGNVVIARDIPWLVDLYEQGRLKLDELVSRRWPFDEINAAIDNTRSGAARRNVVVFD